MDLFEQIISSDHILHCPKCGSFFVKEEDLSVAGPHIKVTHSKCGSYIKFARKTIKARNEYKYEVVEIPPYDPSIIKPEYRKPPWE